jgi:hypothetical protein
MRKAILATAVLAALFLSGCGPQQQFVYTKLDGAPVIDQVKFADDKTLCLAEMDKADVSGTVIPDRNVFIEAQNQAQRTGKLDRIMEACMLQKGYRLKAVAIQAGTGT